MKKGTWEPPQWLMPGWVVMTADGCWWWCEDEPSWSISGWSGKSWKFAMMLRASRGNYHLDFSPPEVRSWVDSKIQIPERHKSVTTNAR